MPLFRRKKDASPAPQGAPAIPGLDLPSSQSILNLAGAHNFGVDSVPTPPATQQSQPNAQAPANGSASLTKEGDSPAKEAVTGGQNVVNDARMGHRSTPSSLSRSASSGPVPYHLPWTRQLAREQDSTGFPTSDPQSRGFVADVRPSSLAAAAGQPTESTTRRLKTPPRRKTGDTAAIQQSSSMYSVNSLNSIYSPTTDFRTSPSAFAQPSPSQRRHVIDSARQMSLKRSKAPSELNIMVVGAQGTGKTSFIRALLATCDLSFCTDETKTAAAFFGIASDIRHPTYDTDPITPLRTAHVNLLSGIDLHPSSLIPVAVLESGAAFNGPDVVRPHSVFSSGRVSSSTSGQASGRIQLSICDTPGIDFEIEDDFEVERKVASYVRHIEQRLQKTLQEESKVQRSQRGGSHVHLVLYFIDPRFMLERIEARKIRRDRARYAFANAAAALSAKDEEKRNAAAAAAAAAVQSEAGRRMRSASLSHHAAAKLAANASASAAAANGTLSKQAQTAQLRESMDAIQFARLSISGATKRTDGEPSRSTTADEIVVGPSTTTMTTKTTAEEEEHGIELLTQQQLSALSRLSERANVLPVIAKADTLTQAQIEEVRTAIRESLVRANIDLGVFEIAEGAKRKRRPYETYRPMNTNGSPMKSGGRDDVISPTLNEFAAEDRATSGSPVKVIRLKTRRSYSATGERVAVSTSGHSMLGHEGEMSAEEGQSMLGHTNPLFDGPASTGGMDEDEVEDVPAPEALAKATPFTLFTPEPVRVRSRHMQQQQQHGRLTTTTSTGGPQRKGSMNSIAEHLPPVPPLPRQLSNMKHKAKQSSVSTASSDVGFVTADQIDVQEVLQSSTSTDPIRNTDSPIDALPAGQSATINVDNGPTVAPAPPAASRRFRRDFRYGHANVLDARHCDFALLRTCILGSHVDQLRESTSQRYEKFRQQKLELSRLTRQASASALQTPPSTATGGL